MIILEREGLSLWLVMEPQYLDLEISEDLLVYL